MNRFFILLTALMIVFSIAILNADWVPEDGHKMHFPQLPNLVGWNVNATNPLVLADDFQCEQTGPVTDIHFWGSWFFGQTGTILGFNISFHADIPADQNPDGYSKPGATLWEMQIPHDWVVSQYFPEGPPEGWYDPSSGMILPENHIDHWQYNIFFDQFLDPVDLFVQDSGTIYWMNISATVLDPGATQWGWKSTLDRWNDDAVWAIFGQLNWLDMLEPLEPTLSLNLAFVINGPDVIGACCYPDPTGGGSWFCVQTTQSDCENNLVGVYEGDGTTCLGMEACCLPDGTCLDADALCCVNELLGTPQGAGSSCSMPMACCLPDGSCIDVDPICCDDLGGTPQGVGTQCTASQACCLSDGQCVMVDPECCDDLGGQPQGQGTTCTAVEACCFPDGSCGDLDPLCCAQQGGAPQGIGTNCSAATIACCFPDGSCMDVDPLCCDDLGGTVSPFSGSCLGDNDGNGTDDGCEELVDQACCFPDGSCVDMSPADCIAQGGTPQGQDWVCSGTTIACCLTDGSCLTLDPVCCDDQGGTPSPIGATSCAGDNNQNSIDDACEEVGACCLPDGACQLLNQTDCENITGAEYKGDGTVCAGDANSNGIDDICEDPWENHKMHYPQLPDEAGWDVMATEAELADDWLCTDSGFIKDIHFWGSWKDGNTGDLAGFIIRVYSDIPVDPPSILYSRPGQLLWEFEAMPDDIVITSLFPNTEEGWYNPFTGLVLPLNHQEYFRYDINLEEANWFEQDSGTIYWLSITAMTGDPQFELWGWKSSINHFNDDAVWNDPTGMGWMEMYEPYEPSVNEFDVEIGPNNVFFQGSGTEFYGDGWYGYPSGWWNIWFYDHPFDDQRKKIVHIEFDVVNTAGPGYLIFALNYSTPQWSLLGNPPGEPRRPPLPGDPEEEYIFREILYEAPVVDGHYIYDIVIPDYNPEWVSIDVQGENFLIPFGFIEHSCVQSMDLSFVLTGERACQGRCGDANGDGSVNVSDAVWIINYVFSGGLEPIPVLACGDANDDCTVNVSDAVYIINYVFSGGFAPTVCCPGSVNWHNGNCCPF